MKHTIAFLIAAALLLPGVTQAQVLTPHEQYVRALSQVIALLIQQVQILQAKLAALESASTSTVAVAPPITVPELPTLAPVPAPDSYSLEIVKAPAEADPEIRFLLRQNGEPIRHRLNTGRLRIFETAKLLSNGTVIATAIETPSGPSWTSGVTAPYLFVRFPAVLQHLGSTLELEVMVDGRTLKVLL